MSTLSLRIVTLCSGWILLCSLLISASLAAHASETPKSVFIVGSCLEKISSDVLSSLEEGIRSSQKYRLAHNLGDGDQMGVVWAINVSCTERKNVAAIATVFGAARCFTATNCHHAVDGSSVRAYVCDANDITECGRALFKAFDDYVSNPIRAPLKLN